MLRIQAVRLHSRRFLALPLSSIPGPLNVAESYLGGMVKREGTLALDIVVPPLA